MADNTSYSQTNQRGDSGSGDETIAMGSAAWTGAATADALSADDEIERMALEFAGTGSQSQQAEQQPPQGVATLMMPTVKSEPSPGPKPVVIKGGPRRVVRADGKMPQTGNALGQKKFQLSSGHEMFELPKKRSKVVASLVGIVVIIGIIAIIIAAWQWSKSSLLQEQREALVSSSSYSYSLSLTPADDGGYYTVFFITDGTDENTVGNLQNILLYRTPERPDRDTFTGALQISVPTNLAVSTTSSDNVSTTASIADILSTSGVTRALTGIDAAFNLRCYNVVVVGQQQYSQLGNVFDGTQAASSFDTDQLFGHVRSNLSLQDIVDYAGKVAATGTPITSFEAPTTAIDTGLVAGSPDLYTTALTNALAGITTELDENGNPVGTLYDEEGNVIYNDDGTIALYGQQYDENGNPVGTHYDDAGNALFDENGNPLGTEYDEEGNPIYDWRGNLVID